MLQVQLPFKQLKKTIKMLTRDLPDAVDTFIADFDAAEIRPAIELNAKQEQVRTWLRQSDYCAFVANGAILPRKGNSALPAAGAVPFASPPQDEIEVCGLRGMGIRKGVTVITGGGYSGKSTLLDAISAGIYNHVAGDGREFVITDDSAMKISAEDGRSVKNVNLSPFIKWLPNSGDPSRFCTEHASGSTSQAANIMEAAGFGSKLFLIDEDKSATNFMIRDDMMKELIRREPITPFTDRVRQLYSEAGISTILVVGGSGEYLSVADSVLMMDEFRAGNATAQAKQIYASAKGAAPPAEASGQSWRSERRLLTERFSSYPHESEEAYSGTERLEISDMGFIIIGDEKIDVRSLHNFISFAQVTAVGYMLRHLELSAKESVCDVQKMVDDLYAEIELKGLDFVHTTFFACERWLDMPRKSELLAVINRLRFVDFV
jgi:predicted ABC-class ATPase